MFRLPGEERAAVIVERAFGRHFELGSQMLERLTAVLVSTNSVELKVPEPVAATALSLMSKAIKLARAVHLLCAVGLSEEAAPLVRVMIEVYAHSKFLSKGDKEKNARRMLALEAIDRARNQERPLPADVVGRAVERAPAAAKQFRENATRWIPDGEQLRELEGLAKQYRQWTGIRISEMVDRLSEFGGIDVFWRGLYGALSSSTHAGDASRHVKQQTEKYVADLEPQFMWGGAMVSHANDLVLAIASSVSKLAPIYSDISLQPVQAMKKSWDDLPMYAVEAGEKIILYDSLVHPVGALEIL